MASSTQITVPADPERVEAARLRYGAAHISCFAGSHDKRALILRDGGVIAYRVCMGVAVAVGDPLCARSRQADAITTYAAECRARRWVPCFYQTDPALRDAYRRAGLAMVKFGEEAIVDVDEFTLDTPSRANLRREVGRARRAGLEATVMPWPDRDHEIWAELTEVSDRWLASKGGREIGFSLGRLRDIVDARGRLTIVRDQSQQVHAFTSWVRLGADALALDLVRRRPDATGGAVDLAMVVAIDEARRLGIRSVSIGAVPFRDTVGDAPDGAVAQRARRLIYAHGVGSYRYRSLAHFKNKFAPRWATRDVALPRGPARLTALVGLTRVHLAP
jgi:phosphatidylglycerol lysyltransferase